MTRRAAPGIQLSTGRLRVDAARAIAKLREYQLAVRAAWVLEAIRAAVASRATRISLTGDTNDLWLSWDCEPWPAADLPRLFDELVGPEASDDRYRVRLLAAAVNSALGMDPAYVDVFAIAATGQAVRARYTPDVLDEPEGDLGEAPLRQVAVEPAAAPPGAGPGMAVHLRRRFGLAVLSHLVRELPEIELARAACADLAVPLIMRGVAHGGGGGAASRDVVRVPFGEDIGGFVAIVDPAEAPAQPRLDMAEHGVVLATAAIALGLPAGDRPVPLRVFVDGRRMPTNASRSEVRHDLPPVSTAVRRVPALVRAAVERLAAELTGGEQPERARAAALMLIAAGGYPTPPELGLERLRELPLARSAVGVPRPLGDGWRGGLVHTGGSPLPEELAPWLGDMLWIPPGDPSGCLVDLEAVDAQAVKRHVRWARREHDAQRRFYRHAPRPPTVEMRELPRLRARLGATAGGSAVDPARFEGLTGEVCLHARGGKGGESELILLLAGREIERVTYTSPIRFTAAIEAPRLRPANRYRGVEHDAEYARVEAAMRGAVLCAVEAIAAGEASAGPGDGFVHGEPDPAADRRLALDGLTLALELARGRGPGVRLEGPLFDAPLWPLAGGDRTASTAELRRHAVIGTTAPGARLRPLPRRCIVEVEPRDEALLAALLPGTTRIVPYDAGLVEAEPLYSIDLAQGLLEESGFALALRGEGTGEGCAAAIAPATVPQVVISHLGRRVAAQLYKPALVPCEIHVDRDDLVPDARWLEVVDDAGVSRHFEAWEHELLRAAASALAGVEVPDLLALGPVELNGPLARALWSALASREPDQLLGPELAARLRAQPLLRLLGEREPVSARDLAARFLHKIPYLDAAPEQVEPIASFTPLLADATLAQAAGQLAGRQLRDAAPELARHRRSAERGARLAQLRARPALPLELPAGGISVRRDHPGMHAVVGVGRGTVMEVDVRVEGRPFAKLTIAGEPPIEAVIDVPIDRLDEGFAALPPAFEGVVTRTVRGMIPALLAEIAKARPEALADLGPVRTMLAAALTGLYFEPPSRAALLAAVAFPTLQGPRVSLAQAGGGGDRALAMASWGGDWLGPAEGEAPGELDRPVFHVPSGADELAKVIARLHGRGVVDVTDAIDKLQAQRRMARGLLPVPAVHGVAPELKRKLAELGPAGAELGLGELGLVDEDESAVLIHSYGELRARVELDVVPPVHLAIEAPKLAASPGGALALRRQAQELALELVRLVLAQLPSPPVWLRHRLRRALISGRIQDELDGAPLFETAAGAWVDQVALARQVELFGDVWCIARPVPDPRPLDERRLVVVLSAAEQMLASRSALRCVDATTELVLDAKARENLARPRPAQLALDPSIPVLATVPLRGDGRTGPRGVVAVLAPQGALHRVLLAHREMYPFDPAIDECLWPTRAIVDDATLTPDRTWSRAERDAAWEAMVTEIRKASERALRDLARPPPRVLASQIITFSSHAQLAALRGDTTTQLRGVLWIDGPPGAPGAIEVVHRIGTAQHDPRPPTGMRGTLLVFGSYHDPWIRRAIEDLCDETYGRLLAKLAARPNLTDPAAAHVAYGISLGRVEGADAKGLRLGCFRPRPIDALEWAALCRSQQRVPLVAPDQSSDELSVTDDGSAVAKVVLEALGRRVGPEHPVPIPPPPERLAPILRDEARAVPPHPLGPLVAAVGARLGRLGLPPVKLAILHGATSPLVGHTADAVSFGGEHPRLRSIAAALLAKTAWSDAAVDALVAHVVTVLNVALTSVTDATEARALDGLLRGE